MCALAASWIARWLLRSTPCHAGDKDPLLPPPRNAKLFVNQMFQLFDRSGHGAVNFRQFLIATNMTSCTSAEFKLRWAFRLFDADESGNIELDEMFEIVATFYEMEGEPREPALDMAEDIFKALDVNGDGSLDEDEFVK